MSDLRPIVEGLVTQVFSAGEGSSCVLAARDEPLHYVQWLKDGGLIRIEVSDPTVNDGQPLSERQLLELERLGFSGGDRNFQGELLPPDSDTEEILAQLLLDVLTGVFGFDNAQQLDKPVIRRRLPDVDVSSLDARSTEIDFDARIAEAHEKEQARQAATIGSFAEVPGVSWMLPEGSRGADATATAYGSATTEAWFARDQPTWSRLNAALSSSGPPEDYASVLAQAFDELSDWNARRLDPANMAKAEQAAQWLLELGEAAVDQGWNIEPSFATVISMYLTEGLVPEAARAAKLMRALHPGEMTEWADEAVRQAEATVEHFREAG